LVGRVIYIVPLGSPNRETDNETDDVHVNFIFDYSHDRLLEIEALFADLYGEEKIYEDCPLDDVIMAPNYLLRITGIDEERLNELLESERNAARYCCEVLSELHRQTEADSSSPGEPSEVKGHILEVIDRALPLAGYKVMDGDNESVIIRHSESARDFEIRVTPLH
jgi:hypothetical protein